MRVGGHLGLRLRWLRLELGTRNLRVRSDRLDCCSSDFKNRTNIRQTSTILYTSKLNDARVACTTARRERSGTSTTNEFDRG